MSVQNPNPAQIRAAISLLNWDNADLAKACGVTDQTISNIKRGVTRPHPRILTDIKRALEFKGIEFLDNQGVRFRPEGIQILGGRDGLIELMEDIYDSCRRGIAGDVVLAGAPEDDFERILGDYDAIYLANMSSIPNFKMRTLIQEGDMNFVSGAYTEYRWAPKKLFQPVPFYAYADKLAIVVFQAEPSPRIFKIQSKTIAEAYRHQFESMWQQSRPIPKDRIKK